MAGEHQQLGVDQLQFGSGLLETAASRDPRTNGIQPFSGNRLDALFAAGHKGKSAERMAVTVGAMTGRLTTAAAEPEGVRASGRRDIGNAGYLIVIIQSEEAKNKTSEIWFEVTIQLRYAEWHERPLIGTWCRTVIRYPRPVPAAVPQNG